MKSAVRGPRFEHDEELLSEKSKIIWLKTKRNLNQFKRRHFSWQTEVSLKKRLGSVGWFSWSYLFKRHRSPGKEVSDLAAFRGGMQVQLIASANILTWHVLKLLALSPEKAKSTTLIECSLQISLKK